MSSNFEFFKLCFVHNFLSQSTLVKQQLLDELVINATDPVIRMRRIRMLHQVCEFESQILKKLETFDTDDVNDFDAWCAIGELKSVGNRSA